jgi:hypothetical protein
VIAHYFNPHGISSGTLCTPPFERILFFCAGIQGFAFATLSHSNGINVVYGASFPCSSPMQKTQQPAHFGRALVIAGKAVHAQRKPLGAVKCNYFWDKWDATVDESITGHFDLEKVTRPKPSTDATVRRNTAIVVATLLRVQT